MRSNNDILACKNIRQDLRFKIWECARSCIL